MRSILKLYTYTNCKSSTIKVYKYIYKCSILFEMYFFLYENFQSQVGNKMVCREMDPESKAFYLF